MLDQGIVWSVAALVVAAVIGAAFALGIVTFEHSRHEGPRGVPIGAPDSGSKANKGGQ